MDKGTQAMGEALRNLSLAFPSLTKLQATRFTAIDASRTSLIRRQLKNLLFFFSRVIKSTYPSRKVEKWMFRGLALRESEWLNFELSEPQL